MKAKSFQDLKAMRDHLQEKQRVAKANELARKEAERRIHAERNLFARAAGKVQPLRSHGRADLALEPAAPIPVQRQLDEQRVMKESISDEFDVSTLLETDDALSFRRPGIGVDVTRRLRRGEWTIQGEIDLHGLRTEEAREALAQFIREAHKHGLRCVRVVHGKGLGSPGKVPVLKGKVHSWLVQKAQVLAFVQARGDEGGAGALVVLLQPQG